MASTAATPRRRIAAERLFYTGMAAAMLLVVFIGFAPSYYLTPIYGVPATLKPTTPIVHLHALVFSAWIVLLMAQTGLVAANRRDIHRVLGAFGLVLVIAMIVLGTLVALGGVARASGPPIVPPLSWLAVPLLGVPVYGGMILAALYWRRDAQTHKRLMLLATAGMLGAAFGRMPLLQGPIGMVLAPGAFTLALLAWDFSTRGRPHRATVLGGLINLAAQVLPLLIWKTAAWLAFARWAAGLVA